MVPCLGSLGRSAVTVTAPLPLTCCRRLRPRPSRASPTREARSIATYADTISSLAAGPQTKVIVQGFTGGASTLHSKMSMDMGTNIVGGTTPSKNKVGIDHLDRPVFGSVREAKRNLGNIGATSVFVPPAVCADAVLEAIEEEIPLIVAVAEGIPLRDQMRIMSALQSQSKSRYLGANSPGFTNPYGCRMGIAPVAAATPGCIGIAARSGTLSYEATGATSDLGLGQSYVLGLGGDFFPGTRTAEALSFLLSDPVTRGIILIGEVGGTMEEDVAEYLNALPSRPEKPIVGFIAGRGVPPGRSYGHHGAIWRDSGSAKEKIERWRKAGIEVVDSVGATAEAVGRLLKERVLSQPSKG